MDKQLTPCPEPKKRRERGQSTAGNHFTQAQGQGMQSMKITTAIHEVFSPEAISFPEDEGFVLAEGYVLMEEEYVMWNEDYTPRPHKKAVNGKHCFDEEVLSFTVEESN